MASTRLSSWSTSHGNPTMANTASGAARTNRATIWPGSPLRVPWITVTSRNRIISSAEIWATLWYGPSAPTNAAAVTLGRVEDVMNFDTPSSSAFTASATPRTSWAMNAPARLATAFPI